MGQHSIVNASESFREARRFKGKAVHTMVVPSPRLGYLLTSLTLTAMQTESEDG